MLTKPCLTLKRRFKASPVQVFSARADREKTGRWLGRLRPPAVRCGRNGRAPGRRYRNSFETKDGEHHEVGASIARWCPTHGSASPGPGTRLWHTIASRAGAGGVHALGVRDGPRGSDGCLSWKEIEPCRIRSYRETSGLPRARPCSPKR